jgi:hypothetical protein
VPDVRTFIPGAPPDEASSKIRKDLEGIKAVGGVNSTERPPDRSDVARFYAATSPTYAFNQIARQLATDRNGSLSENVRALALLNMATSDSLVASFATKYTYNGGIHFRFDQEAGRVLGRHIATAIYMQNLRSVDRRH